MPAREATPVGRDGKSPVPLPEDVLAPEQIEAYLEAVAAGEGLDLAARLVVVDGRPMTSTQMRRLLKRDPELWARVEEAVTNAQLVYRDWLRALARARAETSDRIMEVELGTHVPEYDHLRRDRVKIDHRIEHAIVIPPEKLDAAPKDLLDRLRDLVAELDGEIIDGDVRELNPGE